MGTWRQIEKKNGHGRGIQRPEWNGNGEMAQVNWQQERVVCTQMKETFGQNSQTSQEGFYKQKICY